MRPGLQNQRNRKMSTCKNGRPTILVSDAGRGSAIAIIRSLGRKGWRVLAADSDPSSLGFRSRYAAEHVLYPPPAECPLGFLNAVLCAVSERKVDLVIPVTDAAILPLSEARSEFAGLCKLAIPDATALDITTNKLKTVELAEELGVPTPRTHLVHTAKEAVDLDGELSWPVVLKPQVSRLYRNHDSIEAFTVCYAENPVQLFERMKRFEGRCPVLLQEYCRGVGKGVELLLFQGRPLVAFQHRRLREVPINGGASSLRQSEPLDPMMYDFAIRLMKSLNWTGLAMVEFKVGNKGPKLMEINGRVWGSLPLAVHSGVDFPCRLAELYLNGPPSSDVSPQTTYSVGVRSRNLELDLMWIATVLLGKQRYPFLSMPSRFQGVAALVGLLSPACRFDVMSWEDPRPGLAAIPRIVQKFGSKLRDST